MRWDQAHSGSLLRVIQTVRRNSIVLFVVPFILLTAGPAAGRVFLSVDEALRLAFPGCTISRRTVYLTKAQLVRARELAGVEIPGALVHLYLAYRDKGLVGTAYFDAHLVRTLSETIMIVVDPENKVKRIEVLSFNEPEEYLPRAGWYKQFQGQRLDDGLALKHNIRGITGATLTARATTDAVRRVLAIHQVIPEKPVP